MDHHHDGCPHDHEFGECPLPEPDVEPSADADTSVEETQIVADAAVEIATIEAQTEAHQIDASLEHHQIEAETERAQIDASLEHHQIEASADEEIEEVQESLEDLVEEVEQLEEALEPEPEPEPELESADEPEMSGEVTAVAPPARVEAPSAPVKARRQSAFTKRHSRRR